MADARAGLQTGDGRAAGVGKEVQHRDRAARVLDLFARPVPIHGLLGEEPRVLEVHGLHVEGEIFILHVPALGQAALVPLPAAGFAAGVPPGGALPAWVVPRRLPDGLRVRAHEGIVPPALQLLAARAVDQLIILPVRRNPHSFLRILILRQDIIPQQTPQVNDGKRSSGLTDDPKPNQSKRFDLERKTGGGDAKPPSLPRLRSGASPV